jgi:hypothetical protein
MKSNDALGELNDYEKNIDAFGREIALLYEICGALREMYQQVVSTLKSTNGLAHFFICFIAIVIMRFTTEFHV